MLDAGIWVMGLQVERAGAVGRDSRVVPLAARVAAQLEAPGAGETRGNEVQSGERGRNEPVHVDDLVGRAAARPRLAERVVRPLREEENVAGAVGDAAVVVDCVGESGGGAKARDLPVRGALHRNRIERTCRGVRLAANQQRVVVACEERQPAEPGRHARRRTEVAHGVAGLEGRLDLDLLRVRSGGPDPRTAKARPSARRIAIAASRGSSCRGSGRPSSSSGSRGRRPCRA